jgi:hypothetical protein
VPRGGRVRLVGGLATFTPSQLGRRLALLRTRRSERRRRPHRGSRAWATGPGRKPGGAVTSATFGYSAADLVGHVPSGRRQRERISSRAGGHDRGNPRHPAGSGPRPCSPSGPDQSPPRAGRLRSSPTPWCIVTEERDPTSRGPWAPSGPCAQRWQGSQSRWQTGHLSWWLSLPAAVHRDHLQPTLVHHTGAAPVRSVRWSSLDRPTTDGSWRTES